MKEIHKYIIICFLFISFNALAEDKDDVKVSAFDFEVSYIGDVVTNFQGGIKTGTTYLGLANIMANFDTQYANLWKGGEFFVNLGNTHGGEPSAKLVGDFQGISNIEAGNHTFLYELWFKQKIGKFDFSIGLQDLNANFASSENGALFTNSSFGIQSSISDNISVPVFPLTALGVNVSCTISDSFLLQTAVFDGTPDDFDTNPFNASWKLSSDQGFLAVSEIQCSKSLFVNKIANYKFGVYFHQHKSDVDVQQNNGGFYVIADQQIANKLSVFSQIGFSPKSKNYHNHYYSLGFNYLVLNHKRPSDQLGVAIAYAGIDERDIGSETAIEMTYKLQMNKYIYLIPDIQFIVNPAGTNVKLKNAVVGFIRFGVEL